MAVDMDILEKIDKIQQELSDKTQKLKETISAAEKAADKEIKKIRSACEHDYSNWNPIYFNNGNCGVKRGCSVCGDSEVLSFERYLKESQESRE